MQNRKKHLVILRRLIQSLLFISIVFIIWEMRYPLDRFINPKIYFLLDPFVMVTTAIAERIWLTGLITASITLLVTFLLGRFFCGWICPLGAFLDLWALVGKLYMKLKKKAIREKEPGRPRHVKLVMLIVILVPSLWGLQLAWALDPLAIFVRTFSFIVHPFINNGIDSLFVKMLKAGGPTLLEDFYNMLRNGFLSAEIPEFFHTGDILLVFIIILILSLFKRRFWCRYLCPLGAMLSIPARFSPFRRITSCGKHCRVCMHTCRMNAIKSDNSYYREECILCLDCLADCPDDATVFSFSMPKKREDVEKKRITPKSIHRLTFLKYAVTSAAMTTPLSLFSQIVSRLERTQRNLRPPGALDENEFIQRCIRCGNCMKVCPTNVLKPSPSQYGLKRLWTPVLDTSQSYCEYNCNLCGHVCPTGAIKDLPPGQKKKFIIGIAVINKDICIPFKKGIDCIVCEEHCPVPEKAIKIKESYKNGKRVKLPVIDKELCIGCGICEIKCPTEPEKAVLIMPRDT